MTTFLQETIASIRIENPSFSNALFILPSKRSKIFLRDAITPHLPKPHFLPTIFSIEEFIASISQLKIAPQIDLLFSMYDAYHRLMPNDQQDSFDLFLQWAPPLLKDFNDIDAFLLDPKAVLSDLNAYYALEAADQTEKHTPFTPLFWNNLFTLFQNFTASLVEKNWGTIGMLYREALDGIQIYLDESTQMHYFIGFNALNTAEEYLFQEFLTAQSAKIYWDLDRQFFENTTHASGRFIRRYQKQWTYYRNHPYSFENNHFNAKKNIQAFGFIGNIPQAQQVSQLLQEKINTKESTVVVLGNENFLTPVLSHLPTALKDWNVTMGYSVNQLPLVQFFMHYFTLEPPAKDVEFKPEDILPVFDYMPLRRYFYRQYPAEKKALHRLFHRQNAVKLANEYPWLLSDEFGEVFFCLPETPIARIDQAKVVLEKIEQLFFLNEKERVSFAVIELIAQCLSQLEKYIQSSSFSLNNAALSILFKEQMATQTIDFKGNPTTGVQLMGMLETRTLDFKHVIVTNVNEGILPVGKKDQSFFPFALKKQYGLPTFLDNDAIYTYHFYRLLQRAENVYLLYNAKREGFDAGEKSRFIHQLAFDANSAHQFSDQLIIPSIPSLQNKIHPIEKEASMITALQELAAHGFSPTSLSSYLVDPVAFYTRYLLNVKEVAPKGGVLSTFKRGDIVHKTLELLYEPHMGKLLQPHHYDDMLSRLPGVLMGCYQNVTPDGAQIAGENVLIIRAYERAIKQFLSQECMAISKGDELTIVAMEKEFKVPLPINDCTFPIYIKGKIDRIDRYNGQLRIIDYKTGAVEAAKMKLTDWTKFRGDYKFQALFQVLLYAWAQYNLYATEYPITVGVVSLKFPKESFFPATRRGPTKNTPLQTIDRACVEEIQEFLTTLIQEIFDEQKSFVSLE